MFDLSGKVALVTGSTKGIGKAIARRMSHAGARVVISSRKPDACTQVAEEIGAEGGETLALPCNVSRREELERLVQGTLEAWGRIDILVCNAAANPYYGPFLDIDDRAFDKTVQVNVRSVMWLCELVLPQMAERRDGAVVIVSSIGGIKGSDLLGTYGLTKAAEMAMARNLAVGWGSTTSG